MTNTNTVNIHIFFPSLSTHNWLCQSKSVIVPQRELGGKSATLFTTAGSGKSLSLLEGGPENGREKKKNGKKKEYPDQDREDIKVLVLKKGQKGKFKKGTEASKIRAVRTRACV